MTEIDKELQKLLARKDFNDLDIIQLLKNFEEYKFREGKNKLEFPGESFELWLIKNKRL